MRVVQVSDCHLFASTEGKLLGLNTQFSLDRVLELVQSEQPSMDIILATGDLAQDSSLEAYQRLDAALGEFGVPTYWIEGNHDKPAPMLQALKGHKAQMGPLVIERGEWTIVMLDSTIPGEVPGELYDDDIEFLRRSLKNAAGQHIMVCLHHHPIPMGCKWLDTQVVSSADRFFEVIDAEPRVRAVVWGHVHQEFDGERQGVRLFAVPSTCVQFKPHSDDFAVDKQPPGYRWFDLYPDGRIETQVSRVQGIEFEVDMSVKGY
ncbi:MAG: 3',5'-cyclic-AMP phosphodiesterase [Alcanivoracaceae bacterium]|nr:3',5'-cyclic-AMP phosphodiesterase [Alcanivoracaceae bacterium]